MQTTRAQFETLLLEIAEWAEEWLTSAQAMGLAGRPDSPRVLPWTQSAPVSPSSNGRNGRPRPSPVMRAPARAPAA